MRLYELNGLIVVIVVIKVNDRRVILTFADNKGIGRMLKTRAEDKPMIWKSGIRVTRILATDSLSHIELVFG
jgi:hypothetical protein